MRAQRMIGCVAAAMVIVMMTVGSSVANTAFGNEASQDQTVDLKDVEYHRNSSWIYVNKCDYGIDSDEELYDTCMYSACRDSEDCQFDLDGAYSSLTGILFITRFAREATESEREYILLWDTAQFTVYGDDEVLYTKTGFNVDMAPEEIEVDVTGVEKLKIEFCSNKAEAVAIASCAPLFCLGNAKLVKRA